MSPQHFSGRKLHLQRLSIVTIGCKWSLTDPAKREFTLAWNHGYTDVVNLSADGQRLIGKNNVGDPVAFVRNK